MNELTVYMSGKTSGGSGYVVRLMRERVLNPGVNITAVIGRGPHQAHVARKVRRDITTLETFMGRSAGFDIRLD